jgi:Pyridine nucleotide-disulphide oxidoreductase
MTTRFDAIIIGTGQAGPFLAQRLAAAGQKVAIVERKLFAGTCVNTGCIPTKTMVASAPCGPCGSPCRRFRRHDRWHGERGTAAGTLCQGFRHGALTRDLDRGPRPQQEPVMRTKGYRTKRLTW